MTPSLTSLSNPLSLSRTVTRFPLALTLSLIFPDHNGSIYFTLALTKPSLPLSPCFPLSLSPLIHRHAILSHSALLFYLPVTPALSSFTLALINRLSLTLTLYLCWSPPPPPPLPSHHHGLFLCPLRSLSSQGQMTPLHKASEKGHMAVCELLLSNDADVDARDKVRPTLPPTHIAAASLFSRCCPFLTPSLSPFHTGSLLPLLVFPPSRDP